MLNAPLFFALGGALTFRGLHIKLIKNTIIKVTDQLDSRGDFTKLMNVRHPFARLLSAWHQKFHKNFHNLVKYVRKFGRTEIEKYEDYNDEGENVYSFGAFLTYIANSASMQAYDYHWQTMSFQCMPCQIKYDVLTMQETSASDAVFLLEKKQVNLERKIGDRTFVILIFLSLGPG